MSCELLRMNDSNEVIGIRKVFVSIRNLFVISYMSRGYIQKLALGKKALHFCSFERYLLYINKVFIYFRPRACSKSNRKIFVTYDACLLKPLNFCCKSRIARRCIPIQLLPLHDFR